MVLHHEERLLNLASLGRLGRAGEVPFLVVLLQRAHEGE
jgi:hypothetical protein